MNDLKIKLFTKFYPKSFLRWTRTVTALGDLKGVTAKLDYLADLGVDYLYG